MLVAPQPWPRGRTGRGCPGVLLASSNQPPNKATHLLLSHTSDEQVPEGKQFAKTSKICILSLPILLSEPSRPSYKEGGGVVSMAKDPPLRGGLREGRYLLIFTDWVGELAKRLKRIHKCAQPPCYKTRHIHSSEGGYAWFYSMNLNNKTTPPKIANLLLALRL